ncbi:hypothetical protein J7K43_06810 [Candidatus Calescamantes bacterium]|nr:hypothetical protein [Candidatus Calescamantes bacterium]
MKIIKVIETWIHTHFLTDGRRLSLYQSKEIKKKTEKFLKELGIQFGISYKKFSGEKGIRIILECRPFPDVLRKIKNYLSELIKDIPAIPQETEVRKK